MIRTVTPIQLIISADSNDIHPPTGAVQTYGNMICLPDYKMATVTLKGYVKRSVQLIIKKWHINYSIQLYIQFMVLRMFYELS